MTGVGTNPQPGFGAATPGGFSRAPESREIAGSHVTRGRVDGIANGLRTAAKEGWEGTRKGRGPATLGGRLAVCTGLVDPPDDPGGRL